LLGVVGKLGRTHKRCFLATSNLFLIALTPFYTIELQMSSKKLMGRYGENRQSFTKNTESEVVPEAGRGLKT